MHQISKKQRRKQAQQRATNAHIQQMKPVAEAFAARLPPGTKAASAEQLVAMAQFAERWKKKHPLGNADQLKAAVQLQFNVEILNHPEFPNAD